MRHCYICDASIANSGYRRTVGTGRNSRIYFGRRISSSTSTSAGLRTLCADCAERFDAQARLKLKVYGVAALLFGGFLIYSAVRGDHSSEPAAIAASDVPSASTAVSSAPAAAVDTQEAPASDIALPPAPTAPAPDNTPDSSLTPSQAGYNPFAAAQAASPTPTPTQPATDLATSPTWTNTNPHGIRWNLAPTATSQTLLSIDLGNGQVASIYVDPAFNNLTHASMDHQVDTLRSKIIKGFSQNSASYFYERNGTVRPLP